MLGKKELREIARGARREMADRSDAGRRIADRLGRLDEYRNASVVLYYVGTGDEVPTLDLIRRALGHKRVVVPYCHGDDLILCEVLAERELAPGTWDILEPSDTVRHDPSRRVEPDAVQLAILPGLAFDRRGGRLGQGKGYYDRLLPQLPHATPTVALAFDCQMIDDVPMTARDRAVDMIITESGLVRCQDSNP